MNGNDLKKTLDQARAEAFQSKTTQDLEAWRVKFLGRKGILARLFDDLKSIPSTTRKQRGQTLNSLKNDLQQILEERGKALARGKKQKIEKFDVSLPGAKRHIGSLHPLTIVTGKILNIFKSMGFSIELGPEIEDEYHNFDALNIPADHPARDMWDTFWLKEPESEFKIQNSKFKINENLLLRTHTSPVQIRYMETHQPPFRIVAPGKVYRHEATDANHDIQFHQIEGLMADGPGRITLANLKGILELFLKEFFDKNISMRFRPSYFPFTEPSIEVDIKTSAWLEVMGAGMVHPNVFKTVGYNPKDVQGFAFGMGVERLAMIKYGITDVRMFTNPDVRFLKQF